MENIPNSAPAFKAIHPTARNRAAVLAACPPINDELNFSICGLVQLMLSETAAERLEVQDMIEGTLEGLSEEDFETVTSRAVALTHVQVPAPLEGP